MGRGTQAVSSSEYDWVMGVEFRLFFGRTIAHLEGSACTS